LEGCFHAPAIQVVLMAGNRHRRHVSLRLVFSVVSSLIRLYGRRSAGVLATARCGDVAGACLAQHLVCSAAHGPARGCRLPEWWDLSVARLSLRGAASLWVRSTCWRCLVAGGRHSLLPGNGRAQAAGLSCPTPGEPVARLLAVDVAGRSL
jgi:hypothetical protein